MSTVLADRFFDPVISVRVVRRTNGVETVWASTIVHDSRAIAYGHFDVQADAIRAVEAYLHEVGQLDWRRRAA